MPVIKLKNQTFFMLRDLKEKKIREQNNLNIAYDDILQELLKGVIDNENSKGSTK